jgi:hypothetical protein
MKKDDYLWDGSGEADPEIAELEQSLGRLRYRARPLVLPEAPARKGNWWSLAAAAALLVALAAGLLAYISYERKPAQSPQVAARQSENSSRDANDTIGSADSQPRSNGSQPDSTQGRQTVDRSSVSHDTKRAGNRNRSERARQSDQVIPKTSPDTASPIVAVDLRIDRHIENSQLLLRAFRNINHDQKAVDVSYEKQRSRLLLQQNILLRRNAEAGGNLPVQGMLAELEPLLLDIANLPQKARPSDVGVVKERIEKKEMIAALQVYSTIATSN